MSAARKAVAAGVGEGVRALPGLDRLATSRVGTFVLAAALVISLGFSHGGYDATTWNWTMLLAAVVAAVGLLASCRVSAGLPPRMALSGLLAFAGWTAVGSTRAGAATAAVLELQRDMMYVAVSWAAFVLVRRSNATATLSGLFTGIAVVLSAGLARSLLQAPQPDAFEGRLLSLPLGYANACGILAVLAIVLAIGRCADDGGQWLRALVAASLVPLAVALSLTGSRGGMVAGAVGVGVASLLDRSRRTAAAVIVLTPLPLIAAVAAVRSHVTDVHAQSGVVAHDGRVVAATTVVLALTQGTLALRLHAWTRSSALRRAAARALLACAVLVLGLGVAKGIHGIHASAGDRGAYWKVAWADARENPVLGSGPGSYAGEWLRRRPAPVSTRNAHNLYLETLAETGPIGLLLLLIGLAAPLAALRRARSAVSASAAGAYVAFLVHAGLDWDWQLPAVTATGLACGVCMVALACREAPAARRGLATSVAVVASAVVALAAMAASVGNQALSAAAQAEQRGSWVDAGRLGAVAARWQPWSAEPQRLLGDVELAMRDPVAARRHFAYAVRLAPGDVASWYGLMRSGEPADRALALARLAVLDPIDVRLEKPMSVTTADSVAR